MTNYIADPTKITEASFAMIQQELAEQQIVLDPAEAPIVERMIHTTADFDFAMITKFQGDVISAGVAALKNGKAVVCDVNMVRVGISAKRIEALGGSLHCYVNADGVYAKAAELDNTRSYAGMMMAHEQGLIENGIVVIGNAPTALYAVIELIEAGVKPALVVGVPVGFISAVESKDDLVARVHDVPFITTLGRKGGSGVAVAIVNGLLRLAAEQPRSTTD